MSDFKVGDKAWMMGTVRQVSEADEHNPVTTYMVEIDWGGMTRRQRSELRR